MQLPMSVFAFLATTTETISSARIVRELNNIWDNVKRMGFEHVSYLLAKWLEKEPKRESSGQPEGALSRDNTMLNLCKLKK